MLQTASSDIAKGLETGGSGNLALHKGHKICPTCTYKTH